MTSIKLVLLPLFLLSFSLIGCGDSGPKVIPPTEDSQSLIEENRQRQEAKEAEQERLERAAAKR